MLTLVSINYYAIGVYTEFAGPGVATSKASTLLGHHISLENISATDFFYKSLLTVFYFTN
jgi:hypothetical protein